jgi:hypothetical protein
MSGTDSKPRKVLLFRKKPAPENCSICARLAAGERLWIPEDHGGRLFVPINDTRHCPSCGREVRA